MSQRILIIIVLITISMSGCGTSKKVPVYPVSGKVLLGDKPVASALIVFHPEQSSENETRPRATTGPDGSFTISFGEDQKGAPAGEYRVTIEQWLAGARSDEGPSNRLPAKYSKADTSGLKATIVAGENTLTPFVLKK